MVTVLSCVTNGLLNKQKNIRFLWETKFVWVTHLKNAKIGKIGFDDHHILYRIYPCEYRIIYVPNFRTISEIDLTVDSLYTPTHILSIINIYIYMMDLQIIIVIK